MIHLQSLDVSRLLKGRTRTATFTEDILDDVFSINYGNVTFFFFFQWTFRSISNLLWYLLEQINAQAKC